MKNCKCFNSDSKVLLEIFDYYPHTEIEFEIVSVLNNFISEHNVIGIDVVSTFDCIQYIVRYLEEVKDEKSKN